MTLSVGFHDQSLYRSLVHAGQQGTPSRSNAYNRRHAYTWPIPAIDIGFLFIYFYFIFWFLLIHSHTPDGAADVVRLLSFERPKACILTGYLSLTPPYSGFLERRRPKFKLVKTTFNAENYICRLSQSISSYFSSICSSFLKCLLQQ